MNSLYPGTPITHFLSKMLWFFSRATWMSMELCMWPYMIARSSKGLYPSLIIHNMTAFMHRSLHIIGYRYMNSTLWPPKTTTTTTTKWKKLKQRKDPLWYFFIEFFPSFSVNFHHSADIQLLSFQCSNMYNRSAANKFSRAEILHKARKYSQHT